MSGENTSGHDPGGAHTVDDGTGAQDDRLPTWWPGLLCGAILLGGGYWMYAAVTGLGSGVTRDEAALGVEAQPGAPASDEVLLALGRDVAAVEQGRALFAQQCAACHGAQAQGFTGPNLTDGYWLHGGRPMDIHRAVAEGVPAKGMPGWERTLGPQRVQQVVAYVLTLKNSNVPGKGPQGEQAP